MDCKAKIMACILTILAAVLLPQKQEVSAGVWNNAYEYYRTYGNQVVFCPTSQTDGYLYYATGANNSSAGTRFRTIGWKVSLKNAGGAVIQTLYFQLGGRYMSSVNTYYVSGYEYILYRVSLSSLKTRLNSSAAQTLAQGNCSIVFDACMTIVQNGTVKGGIDDSGKTWGKVYTTYQGIVGAAAWSSASKVSLQGYFNKYATGLFFRITLKKGGGIASVSGSGLYCYGTYVTVAAAPENGYVFSYWSGTTTSYSSRFGTYVNGNYTWTAYGKQKTVSVTFYRNGSSGDAVKRTQVFSYGSSGQKFSDPNWYREGYELLGWAHSAQAGSAAYSVTSPVSNEWIAKYSPAVSLYGIWTPNRYTVVFDGNGAERGSVAAIETAYDKTVCLPENAFVREKEACTFLGWSRQAETVRPDYAAGEEVPAAELAKMAGVAGTNHAVITLYAVWDLAPAIAAKDLYYTLEEAQKGMITERELASHMTAADPEDGRIPYGKNESNSFVLSDYAASDFSGFTGSGSVTERAVVTDSSGNRTVRIITVHLTDTTAKSGMQVFGKCRFISPAYFEDSSGQPVSDKKGGLSKTSCWVQEADYRNLLRAALSKMQQKK